MKRRDFLHNWLASTGTATLRRGSLVLWLGAHQLAGAARIVAMRIWPAPDYTRVTIESDVELQAKHLYVEDPPRLAVDIAGLHLEPALRELVGSVKADDPNIARMRVAQYTPEVVRLVIDLKQPILPQVFTLPPVARYQHRLVFDLYPTDPPDPLAELIAQRMADVETAVASAGKSGTGPTDTTRGTQRPGDANDPLGALIALHKDRPTDTQPAKREPTTATATGSPRPSATAITAANPAGRSSPTFSESPPRPSGTAIAASSREAVGDAPVPTPRQPSPSPAPAASVGTATDRLIIVALDPGHGGEDPGAIGPGGTREKDVVLQIARKLQARINAAQVNGNPLRAFMTRDADFFVPLHIRVEKARRVQADLMISLHADAFFSPDPQGGSIYALSTKGASSAAARWMAQKENDADVVGGLNVKAADATVQRAMLDMSTTAQINDSLRLGAAMHGEMSRLGRMHKPKVEQANFAVLRAPDIPSVLVETAFISNPDEEARLKDPDYQNQLADALMRGILRYFQNNPPLARNRAT